MGFNIQERNGREEGGDGERERRKGRGWLIMRPREEDGFARPTMSIVGHRLARGWTRKRSYSSESSLDLAIRRPLVTFVSAFSLG